MSRTSSRKERQLGAAFESYLRSSRCSTFGRRYEIGTPELAGTAGDKRIVQILNPFGLRWCERRYIKLILTALPMRLINGGLSMPTYAPRANRG